MEAGIVNHFTIWYDSSIIYMATSFDLKLGSSSGLKTGTSKNIQKLKL